MNKAFKLVATSTPYLYLRGRKFYFRASIPTLNPAKPYAEVCVSLRTSSLTHAKFLAAKMGEHMAEAKNRAGFGTPEVRERVLASAREYFQATLAEFNANIRNLKIKGDLPSLDTIEAVEYKIAEARADLHDFDYRQPTIALAQATFTKQFANIQHAVDTSDVSIALCEYLTRAKMTALKVYLARLNGATAGTVMVQDDVFKCMDLDVLPTQKAPEDVLKVLASLTAGEPLDAAIEAYVANRKSMGRNEKTAQDIRVSLRLFKFIFPDVIGVKEITKAKISEFETKLANMPTNYSKLKTLKDLPYAELVAASKDMEKFSPATHDKHAVTLRAFVKWCQETDRMDNFKLPSYEARDKASPQEKRHPFDIEDLKVIFTSPQYTGHQPDTDKGFKRRSEKGKLILRDSYYWIPIVALYSGMRLNEIAQLGAGDIKTEQGVLYFHVTDEGLEGKSLKNRSSLRKIPVHPMLMELGFGEHLHSMKIGKHARVFYHLQKGAHESYASNFSKHFGRYKNSIGITDPKKVFHSFRHTFIDQALKDAKLTSQQVKALVGHVEHDVTHGTYGSKMSLPELLECLSKIEYPTAITKHLSSNV